VSNLLEKKTKIIPDPDEIDNKPIPISIPYSHNIATFIIGKIFENKKLSEIAGKNGVPDLPTIFGWMHKHKEFRQAYDVARESQALLASEEIYELSRLAMSLTKDEVPAAKLKFDILKFIAERNDRDRYAQAPSKQAADSGTTIVINTGISKDASDTRTVNDLILDIKEEHSGN
jgi:hypothetical protein